MCLPDTFHSNRGPYLVPFPRYNEILAENEEFFNPSLISGLSVGFPWNLVTPQGLKELE